jgi:hypothetical protein
VNVSEQTVDYYFRLSFHAIHWPRRKSIKWQIINHQDIDYFSSLLPTW